MANHDKPLSSLLSRRRPLVLDGAMGTELQRRGVDVGLPLWSANALLVAPDVVLQIHRESIDAGADIITTATFRTTARTFRRAALPDRSAPLTRRAVDLAKQARSELPERTVLIAGSVAPLEDCYRPDLVPATAELAAEHAEHTARLAAEGVDFLLLETMGTVKEIEEAARAAAATGKEFVVSFLCATDGRLYSGEPLGEAVAAACAHAPAALSVNCVSPKFIESPLEAIARISNLPLFAYGNVGLPNVELTDTDFTRDVGEDQYAAGARSWVRRGVAVVGGCCGTTPDDVRAVAHALEGMRFPPAGKGA